MSRTVALIVGSGLAHWPVAVRWTEAVETPFGETSSPIGEAAIGGHPVTVIARHGTDHSIAPHEVNYRANVWALRMYAADIVVGLNVVGGIAPGFRPGDLAVPDQLIDYTTGRDGSFGDIGNGIPHIDFTEPFDPVVAGCLAAVVAETGFVPCRGVFGVTQGPRLETAAEIDRLERDGCAMVGMTAMPEAALAREAGLAYAVLAASVNYAAGRSPAGEPILAGIEEAAAIGMERMARALALAIPALRATV